jgi:hypothetical protein
VRIFACLGIPLLLVATTANAEAVKCAGEEFGKPYEMTMIYEGGDSGTMTITGSFGEMSLPGAKTQREGVNADGDKVSATEIWASGEVPLIVPEKAAIESCIKGKLTPEQVTDSDIVFTTIGSCAAASPPTAQPIPVKVYAEIGMLDPQTLEKTDLPDGTMTLEPLPPPRCTAQ